MISVNQLINLSPKTVIKDLVFSLWLKDAGFKLFRIRKYLSYGDNILEIGAGSGSVSLLLNQEGYKVTPLDIKDKTLTEQITPILYSGETLPFPDKSFDTAIILTVLHHTPDPERILREAMRVADNIVIIEDIYDNKLQQYLTYIFDSIFNFEFLGHPHSNKTDTEWKEQFSKLGLRLREYRHDRFLIFFKQATYSLSRK